VPFGVLLGTSIVVFAAGSARWLHDFELDVCAQISLVMVIGLAAKNAEARASSTPPWWTPGLGSAPP
jgi:hypothetical protein